MRCTVFGTASAWGLDAGREDWRHRAACRDEDPGLFFPIGTSGPALAAQIERAKAVCRRCPVLDECLDWAHEIGDQWAILGATIPVERSGQDRRRVPAHVVDTVRQLVAAGWSDQSIGERLGRDRSSVQSLRARHGIAGRRPGRPVVNRSKESK